MAGTNIALTSDSYNKGSDKSWLATRMGLQDMRSITLDISAFNADHISNGYIPSGTVLGKITATGKYGPYKPGTVVQEVQSLVATGGSAGDFTLTFDGETTAAIAYNAAAADVQAALEALSNIEVGDVVCAGGPLPTTPVTITFGGQYADTNVPALVVADNVTDGNAVISTTTPGGGSGAATDGTEVAAGLLFEEVKVVALTDADCGAALYWRGVVKTTRLPNFTGSANGIGELDADARAALSNIRFED